MRTGRRAAGRGEGARGAGAVCKRAAGRRRHAFPPSPLAAPRIQRKHDKKRTQSVPREMKSETMKGDSRRDGNNTSRAKGCCARAPCPRACVRVLSARVCVCVRNPSVHVRPVRAGCEISMSLACVVLCYIHAVCTFHFLNNRSIIMYC